MNTRLQERNPQAGSSLILALTLTVIAATAAGTAYYYAASQAQMNRNSTNILQARAVAEAGLNLAYNQLRANIALTNNPNPWPWTNFGNGQYMVTPTMTASNLITLVSVGQFNGAQTQVRMNLQYYPAQQSGSSLYGPYVFNYVLYIGGNCSWAGCGTFNGGSIYVNGPISLTGSASWGNSTGTLTVASSTSVGTQGAATIKATTITAPSISGKGVSGTEIIGKVAAPTLPSIELSPFYQIAAQNGQVKTGSISVANGFTPPGGVLWCVGSLDFKGTATGCFIATAGVSLEASAAVYPVNTNWPTIYNQTGNINFAGQANTYGFVYTGGNVQFAGGGAMQGGPVIIMGNLNKAGNSTMTANIPNAGFLITPPIVNSQQSSNTLQRLVITGWDMI